LLSFTKARRIFQPLEHDLRKRHIFDSCSCFIRDLHCLRNVLRYKAASFQQQFDGYEKDDKSFWVQHLSLHCSNLSSKFSLHTDTRDIMTVT
jgi:hypothetical protein